MTSSPMTAEEHSHENATRETTPSTSVANFSPESTKSKGKKAVGPPNFKLHITPAFLGKVERERNDDIFLNIPSSTSTGTQLSPTAEAFTPRARPVSTSSAASSDVVTVVPADWVPQGNFNVPALGPVVETMFENLHFEGVDSPDIHNCSITQGTFSTDENITRAFAVGNVARSYPLTAIAAVFKLESFPSLKGINASRLAKEGVFYLSFGDVRHAKQAFALSSFADPSWQLMQKTPKQLAQENDRDAWTITNFEGQVLVTVHYSPSARPPMAASVITRLKDCLRSFGDIKAICTLPAVAKDFRKFRVEFFNTEHAVQAIRALNHEILGDMTINVAEYQPDVVTNPNRALIRRGPEQLSITGRSVVPCNNEYNNICMALTVKDPNTSLQVRRGNPNGAHNQVSVSRIQAGVDVRTTIMLRNIPNKVDQEMMKAYLDETSFGDYDFMYLRIDFANNCNVGYAFINFVDASRIIPFARARAGRRWNAFNSEKIAEISYATIQGRDCLITKFRNSSVMLEHPSFRPKLYIAGTGPDAGEEEMFPPPDNWSKMRRSLENAEHVGLFKPDHSPKPQDSSRHAAVRGFLPPARATLLIKAAENPECQSPCNRALILVNTSSPTDPFAGCKSSRLFAPRQGQAYREEQRRRRSQFDRGTPGAEHELLHLQATPSSTTSTFPRTIENGSAHSSDSSSSSTSSWTVAKH